MGEDFGESLAEGLARLTELETLHLTGFRNLYGLDAEAAPLLAATSSQVQNRRMLGFTGCTNTE